MMRALVLVVSCLFLSSAGWAEEGTSSDADAQARVYFENGRYHFENGKYEEAIIAWQSAYALSGRHELLYNIASAQERLGLWQQALDSLNTYRTFADPEEWTSLERRITNLERRINELATQDRTISFTPDFNASTETEMPAPATRSWGLPLTLGGTAMIGAGVLLAIKAQAAGEIASEGCREAEIGLLCSDEVATQIRQQRNQALGADLSMGLGALATAGGVYFMIEGRF